MTQREPGGPGWRARLSGAARVQGVAFWLGTERFACDAEIVDEVVFHPRLHALPDMPTDFLGVLRLRGELVPVLDLARVLGVTRTAAQPALLVARSGTHRVGLAVDDVEDVIALQPGELHPPPTVGVPAVVGVAHRADGLVSVLDLAEIIRDQEPSAPEERL